MEVLHLGVPEGFQWLIPVTLGDGDVLRDVCGVGAGANWNPPAFELLTADEGRTFAPSDTPWLGDHVVPFRAKARVQAEPLLAEYGEFLPLAVAGDDEFSVFNALRTYDALDEDRSTIAYGRRTGKIINIEGYSFRDGVLPRRAVFRLPQEPLGTFFTEDLADDLLALDLAGLRLEPIGRVEPA